MDIQNFNIGVDGKPMPVHLCTWAACDVKNCPSNPQAKGR